MFTISRKNVFLLCSRFPLKLTSDCKYFSVIRRNNHGTFPCQRSSSHSIFDTSNCINRDVGSKFASNFTRFGPTASFNSYKLDAIYKIPSASIHQSCCLYKSKGKKGKKPEVFIRHEDAAEFIDLNEVQKQMNDIISNLKEVYIKNFRIGADINIFDEIKVVLEGEEFELREVAQISKKSPKVVQLDFISFPEALKAAETAIQSTNLNLNPTARGTKLDVPIPVITTEHRKILVKGAKKHLNDTKEELRGIRASSEKIIKSFEKIPEDTATDIRKQVGVYMEAHFAEADEMFKGKEKDLLLQK